MEAWGIRHADVTGAQQRLYRQFVKTGAPFTWEAMAKIETQAIVHGSGYSLNFETVKPTVDAALHHIRTTMGVAQPFRIPWGGL